ncbi:histidine kinase dimerization/phospho-acceptor domain-containing protein [Paraglaciecola sp. L1A13]|uniref:histidine kinase dimerization/phospho-acceptor domain-containing protein n=1 Tax=Paraglaciecola sp. L1A13 TaxID=2686359 RepID=UPI00131BC1F7|nr:histidine kinase dimerization/phospho-acceptor domain-containing protein [Paraglaciecola sp. L1A13]|tara:strand:- start:259 stop:480 length:222 start_codon:yes stop_codon:yes gene_type:complete
MNNKEANLIRQHIHDVRNPLNSIALHAELGNMLLEGQTSSDKLANAFTVILQQCRECDRVLGEIRKLASLETP